MGDLRIEALSIGDELLDGRLADTNSQYLADELAQLGMTLHRVVLAPDDIDALCKALQEAAARADIVVTSGGLGPTTDDLTAEAIAQAVGCGLRLDEEVWERIQQGFADRGWPLPPNNIRQAQLPETSTTLPNEAGVAPGFCTPIGDAKFLSFPGVPTEYRWMVKAHLLPLLKQNGAADSSARHMTRTLRCLGITESALDEALAGMEEKNPDLKLQYRTSFPENHVRLLVHGAPHIDLAARVDALAAEAKLRIGAFVYGEGNASLEERVVALLQKDGATLTTAESCTGGMIGEFLTKVPGVSDIYAGGVIAYANALKTDVLGVKESTLAAFGAVSEAVAAEMADGARQRWGSTYALSVTGIAGPGGGTEEKPIGTVCFGLAGPAGTRTFQRHLPFRQRERIRAMATAVALRALLRELQRETEDAQSAIGV